VPRVSSHSGDDQRRRGTVLCAPPGGHRALGRRRWPLRRRPSRWAPLPCRPAAPVRSPAAPGLTCGCSLALSAGCRSRYGRECFIPPKANLCEPIPCDFRRYRDRNRIERMFGHQAIPPHRHRIRQNRLVIRQLPQPRCYPQMAAELRQRGLDRQRLPLRCRDLLLIGAPMVLSNTELRGVQTTFVHSLPVGSFRWPTRLCNLQNRDEHDDRR